MYKRHVSLPSQSFFLFGARGTGKTTLLREKFAKTDGGTYWIDLLDEQRLQRYLADTDLFRREVSARPKNQWIVVDEVQRFPALLNYVHQMIEQDKRKFALTGSSARKLRQKGVNLLVGRALVKHLYPLVPTEMGADFKLSEALRFGTLPVVVSSPSPYETLAAYTSTYLKEEIKAEALVKNLPGFSRFFEVAALFHGQILNISNVARECAVSRTTATGFFSILEDTLVGALLPAYASRPKVRESRHPKFYFFDPGVVRTIKNQSGVVDADERGFLLEGFVFHCLTAYGKYGEARDGSAFDELAYWSPLDAKSLEVDFILRRGRELTAIEVKAKTILKPDDLKGLKAASSLKGIKKRYLVYCGEVRQNLGDGMIALPFFEFCELLANGKI